MIKKILIFAIAILCTYLSYGQSNKSKTISLDSTIIKKRYKTILLMENDTFSIFTTYQIFIENCENWINKHNIEWDKDLLSLITKDKSSYMIDANKIIKTNKQKSRLMFRISDLIEAGNCNVFNRITKKKERAIDIEYFQTKFVYGRRFWTSDKILIFEIIDGVF
jgi:hypothetical protein